MSVMIQSTDGVEVALHDLGGHGPPLLLLHATGFHGRCYQQIANHLHDHFHVWAPDLRGHGDAITPDMALPWRGMADDALAVLDHLGIDEPVRACGHSMGGATVVTAELRRPGTIRAAWIYEPIIFPPHPAEAPENPLAVGARRRRHDFASFDEATEHLSGRGPFTNADPAALHDYVTHGFRETDEGVTLKTSGENEARTFEGVDTTVFGRLGEVVTPITVVGSGDGGNPALIAPMVAEALPNSRLVTWTDRSHFGPLEDPARAAAEIIEALG